MRNKYDHPEYEQPHTDDYCGVEDELFLNTAEQYEETHPPFDYTEEEFYVAEMEYMEYIQQIIDSTEEGVTLR